MNALLKKLLVLLPVCLVGMVYFYDHSSGYRLVSGKRLLLLGATLVLLYGWIFLEIWKRKQDHLFQLGIQSSFYVYVFMVLTLTGYFILFREISSVGWWDKMLLRIERNDHVNFDLFEIFRIYEISDTQVIGNLLMLLPLGIYLPLLYKKISSFFAVLSVSLLFSCFIEFLQLVTSYRSADIDDVMLNTAGAGFGYLLYFIARYIHSFIQSRSTHIVV